LVNTTLRQRQKRLETKKYGTIKVLHMSTFDDLTEQTTFPSIIGRKVVDERGDDIGTLDALWTDEDTGKVEFLGVKTGWIFGKTHVVPAHGAQMQEDYVRVPYQADFVKDAPSYPPHEELSYAQEGEVYDYYGISREEVTTVGTVSTAGEAGEDTGALAETRGTDLRAEDENSVENPVVERGPAGAREPIGEPTVPGVRSAALPGDRDIARERRAMTGEREGTRGGEETDRPSGAAEIAPGMDIAPEAGSSGAGTRDLGVGRVRLRKFWRGEQQTEAPADVQRETPGDQTRTGKGVEDTGQAGALEPTGGAGTGTGAGTSGAGSSGLTGAESEAERARERERLDR
jgi:sporulation protein YlmC with PRC-barrel domain